MIRMRHLILRPRWTLFAALATSTAVVEASQCPADRVLAVSASSNSAMFGNTTGTKGSGDETVVLQMTGSGADISLRLLLLNTSTSVTRVIILDQDYVRKSEMSPDVLGRGEVDK